MQIQLLTKYCSIILHILSTQTHCKYKLIDSESKIASISPILKSTKIKLFTVNNENNAELVFVQHLVLKVVLLGGHIDSWDVGQGAMDDGGGAVVSWQALSLIRQLGLRPKRTMRLIMWTSEVNNL